MTTTPDYPTISRRLKALAHPVRLQILDALRQEPECVCHLATLVGKPQPYVSQQLRILREEGILRDEKEGQNIYYHLVDSEVRAWLALILGETPLSQGHQKLAGCSCPKCETVLIQIT